MPDPTTLVPTALAAPALGGGLLGLAYYTGLGWTVRRVVAARHPVGLYLGSFVVRGAAALAGLYTLGGGQGFGILAALIGFALARPLAMRLWPKEAPPCG